MELSTAHELHPLHGHVPPSGGAPRTQRYAIISELGGGAMSTVHLAHDTTTGRVVAIKRVAERAASVPGAAQRFAREASVVEQLRHPNIVQTIAIERDDAAPIAIVTEYVRGASLRDVLRDTLATSGAFPVERAVRILRDVAVALGYVHARHIVHRDVKPANVLIDAASGRAILADFGIACESGAHPDVDGLAIGTPAYMAPEQIEGRPADPRVDVYALCVVGWELLAGCMPWLGAPLADVLHRQRYESLPDLAQLRPDIPVYLLRAIERGLAKDPAHRCRDGAELLRQLSPTPTPLVIPVPIADAAAAPMPLDATIRLEPHGTSEAAHEAASKTAHEAASEITPMPEPYGIAPSARAARDHVRRIPLLASTIAAIALLLLASLAPRLSRAIERRAPVVDPELDSMLTLAVAGHSVGAAAASARRTPACRAHPAGRRGSGCAPSPRRASSRTARRSSAGSRARR